MELIKKIKKILKIFIYIIFILVIIIISSEVILRAIDYKYKPIKIRRLGKKIEGLGRTDWRPIHEARDDNLVYDPDLIWRPKKDYSIFNSQGFIGTELSEIKKKGEYRIFAIGDSNTAGGHPAWPVYLGNLLKRRYPYVTVINAGVWGYSSFQGLGRFKEILKYDPDMVIISFGANDAHMVTLSDRCYISGKKNFKVLISRIKLLQLISSLHDYFLIKFNESNMLVPRVSQEEYRENIETIISIAQKKGIEIILLTRPFIGEVHNELEWKNVAPKYNDIVLDIAKDKRVMAIDIYSNFKEMEDYFCDECHFTREGHLVAARIMYKYVERFFAKKLE